MPQGSLAYENNDVELIPSFEKRGYRTKFILYVNGKRVPENVARKARPNQTLLSFVRDELRLTGSKLGCAEGGCGACTVMISKKDDRAKGSVRHYSVNACLMPVLAADGCHVTTVEGVGSVNGDNDLHPIQQAMVDMHGSQCGFCTPGIIVSIYSLFANNPSAEYIEEHMDGNLCRCTGYRPIWDAARSLCSDGEEHLLSAVGPCGTPCRECPERETCEMDCNVKDKTGQEEKSKEGEPVCSTSSLDKMKHYESSFLKDKDSWLDQPSKMFPKELLDKGSKVSVEMLKPLLIVDRSKFHRGGTWFKPNTLIDFLDLMKKFGGSSDGGCKIVVGNTEVGIEAKFKHAMFPRLISPSETITELYDISYQDSHMVVGSCVPLSTIEHECGSKMDDDKVGRIAKPIHDMLRWFASGQIRNVACLGGNLVTASPISDMNPMLAAMGATLVLASLGDGNTIEQRRVPVSEFFLKYRVVDLKPQEVVASIEIPYTKSELEYVMPFKQARRREDDISIVTAGMRIGLHIDNGVFIIDEASLAFGGMATKTVMALKTAEALVGKPFSAETFSSARKVLLSELTLPDDVPGGQAQYRQTLTASFLHRFFIQSAEELRKDAQRMQSDGLPPIPVVSDMELSGAKSFVEAKKPIYKGTQKYPQPKVAQGLEGKAAAPPSVKSSAVGKPSPHMSGALHCTGEALYTDDIPIVPGTLQAFLVLSSQCGVTFEGIDKTGAMATPGVFGVYVHKDLVKLGGDNNLGPILHDDVVFLPVGEKVRTVGQVLGIVVGESLECAEIGAKAIKVNYGEENEKTIVTIEDAIEASSFYEFSRHTLERGEVDKAFNPEELGGEGKLITVEGSFRSGTQEHFYLETNSSLVVPSEYDLKVYSSTQAASETQKYCASATNMPSSKVAVHVKRMGGGFGGKETRSMFASCAAAVAAKISNRPVRLTLGRDVDMSITGARHAFLSKYKASALLTNEGLKLHGFDVQIYANGGSTFDLSGPVVDRALFHIDNCYFWPNFRAVGVPCKTVQPPHTAFRGFGGPQGMAICEHVVDHLIVASKVPPDSVRRQNLYNVGQATHFGMVIGETNGKWNVPSMWDRLAKELNVSSRRSVIEEFNSQRRWVKRGLSFIPTKFGIAFTAKHMNQGGALVHLYTDGTVLVSHGGTEMGQGLHTKVCQVAAQAFGIPIDCVYIDDTSTDKVANTIATAASASTDMYGMATLDGCRQIIERLKPIREKLGPDASLKEVATAAHLERIDLSAHGFYILDTNRCGYDWFKEKPKDWPEERPANAWKGHPFNYFTQGVVCTEVEIDALTGNHRTLKSDVIVDVGSSINPAIDIGQIEGAFIQGMGWSTLEEMIYSDDDHTWIRPRGKIFTAGPGTYKIPAFNDVPEEFNVTLLEDVDNPLAVHSSKAIGEPPFFLGTGVFYAIKEAVRAARKDNLKEDSYFEMRLPATSERIRMLCADEIAAEGAAHVSGGPGGDIRAFQAKGTF